MDANSTYTARLNDLFNQVNSLGNDDRIQQEEYLQGDIVDRYYPLVRSLIDSVFITEKGNPNYHAINIFEDNGIKVKPLESDAFGWVTGGVCTKKGIIVF